MLLRRAIMFLIGANMLNCAHIYLAAIVLKRIHICQGLACMCEHVSTCHCITYMSACEQCCRLCNNSMLFKVMGYQT